MRKIKPLSLATALILLVHAPCSLAAYIGWGVGSGGTLVRSNDDGNIWTSFSANAGFGAFPKPHPDLYAVAFPDTQDGWIAGANGVMLHTTNGGLSWTSQTTHVSNATIYRMKFVDSNNGWAVGSGGSIIHTSDGGAHWTVQNSATSNILIGLASTDALNAWAVGDNGTIVHTSNGGANWIPQISGTAQALYSAAFTDASIGWSVGFGQTLLHTVDSGATWAPIVGPFGPWDGGANDLSDARFFDALHGWVIGSLGAGYTSDGGANWTITIASAGGFNRLAFPDPLNGWLSDDGDMLHTTDGGLTWSSQSVYPTTNNAITDITFITAPEPSLILLLPVTLLFLRSRRRFSGGLAASDSGTVI